LTFIQLIVRSVITDHVNRPASTSLYGVVKHDSNTKVILLCITQIFKKSSKTFYFRFPESLLFHFYFTDFVLISAQQNQSYNSLRIIQENVTPLSGTYKLSVTACLETLIMTMHRLAS